MKELCGDIFVALHKQHFDAIVCTINCQVKKNGELVMGAGVAKAFAQQHPWLPLEWGKRVSKHKDNNYIHMPFITLRHQRPHFIALPTKIDWQCKSDISLVAANVRQLSLMIDVLGLNSVLLPRPGCANGGLSWAKMVKPICLEHLDERFTIISKD